MRVPLLEDFNVLTYDPRGLGKSERPSSNRYFLEDHIEDLKSILDENDIGPCHLFGLSNGGRVVLKFSELYPERVLSVSASDTYFHLTELLKLKLNSWKKAQLSGGALLRFDIATPWIWGETLVDKKPELISYYRNKAHEIVDDVAIGLIEGALQGEIDERNIHCPVLLLCGKEDLLTPPSYHESSFEKLVSKKSEFHLINGGHGAPLEYPFQCAKIIKDFILKNS